MRNATRPIRKTLAAILALVMSLCFLLPAGAFAATDDKFTMERIPGATQKDVTINGVQRVVYCMQYDYLWPVAGEGYANAPTQYREANAGEMLLNDEQLAVIQRVLFAGYPYDGAGCLAPLYEHLGTYAADPASDLTQGVIWMLMNQWGITGNSHYSTEGAELDDVPGMQEAFDNLMDFALNGTISTALPEGYVPGLTSPASFTEADGVWTTGQLTITDPAGFNLQYNVSLPAGIVLLDRNGEEMYANWDFDYSIGEFVELGYTLYGGDVFYLQAYDAADIEGAQITITCTVKLPTDIKQYMTEDTGLGNKNDGQGYVQHPFQTMLSVGIQSGEYTGTVNLLTDSVDIAVTKAWNDNDDEDGLRPTEVVVELLANGQSTGETLTLTPHNDWCGVFVGMPGKTPDGTVISYSVVEIGAADGYEPFDPDTCLSGSVEEGFVITNTHEVETLTISGVKTWENDTEANRPASVIITLHADVAGIGPWSTEVTPNADGVWAYSFTDLPVYHQGERVIYTIGETLSEDSDYHPHINGFDITNHYDPELTAVQVEKVWDDNDDQDGIRPDTIVVYLVEDGERTDITLTLGLQPDGTVVWGGEFDALPRHRMDANGDFVLDEQGERVTVTYTVEEDTPKGYTCKTDGNMYEGFVLTNTHTTATTSISVTKTWEDQDNVDGRRPDTITVNLYGVDGAHVDSATISPTADGVWSYTFTDLPAFHAGGVILYTVEEVAVDGYTAVVTGDANNGFTITNTHEPEKVTISGIKHWDDNDNADGNRPESITLTLENRHGEVVDTAVVTPNADGVWAYSFADLPAYEHGEKAIYFVIEEPADHYVSAPDREDHDITNIYHPTMTMVKVTKVWEDDNDKAGARPESITVELLQNGESVGITLELSEENGWVGIFEELPSFLNREEVVYTVAEIDAPAGYESVTTGNMTDGFTITNTKKPTVPPTGDSAFVPIIILGVGMLLALAIMVLALVARKRGGR